MTSINLEQLPSSTLFRDVLTKRATVFPRTEVTNEFCAERALAGPPRSRVTSLIEESMKGLTLSEKQTTALETLNADDSVVVTTGQQVGFLGGPLYTLLKMRTMVQRAAEIEESLGVPTVPIFWLEDNDHDAAEASTTSFLTKEPSLSQVTHWDGQNERMPVWQRTFDEAQLQHVEEALKNINGQFSDEVIAKLHQAYSLGAPWSSAFLTLIEPFLQEWGVLVVKGSEITNSGMHVGIVQRDLKDAGALSSVIENTGLELKKNGYHLQASASELLFFLHDDTGRHRIDRDGDKFVANGVTYSVEDLRNIAASTPERFSPSALARPLVQDAILPTVASVLGAAEVAYHAQITDAYKAVGIDQPVPMVRHHAVLLDRKTERNLAKLGSDVEMYFNTWEDVEQSVSKGLSEDVLPDIVGVDALIQPWRDVIPSIDETLVKRVEATASEITSALQALNGKARSAVKKKNQVIIDRHNSVWWLLNPGGTRNERVYPLASWMATLGTDALRIIVETICSEPETALWLAGPSDIEQDNVA